MLPPSATLGLAVRLTVVASIVSVMAVLAELGSMATRMPPPEVLAICAETEPGSTYTSSLAGNGTLMLPLVCPAAIRMTAPLDKVTLRSLSGAWVMVAV